MIPQPPTLAYANPADQPTPTCVSVISIIGIVLGSLTVLNHVFGLAFLGLAGAILARTALSAPMFGPRFLAYQIFLHVLFGGFGGWLLAAAIGCVRRREWGRVWLIRYAIGYPIALLVEVGGSVLVMIPTVAKMMTTTMKTAAAPPIPRAYLIAFIVGGQVVTLIVLLILPGFILALLRKQEVRAVFT